MRELNVNEVKEVKGGGACEAYAQVTEKAFTFGGGLLGSAFGGVGGLAGAALGGLLGSWASGIVREDCVE